MKVVKSPVRKKQTVVAPVREGESVPEKKTFLIMSRAWHEDGVWNVSAFDLPVAVYGRTLEEAQRHFDAAIVTHFWGLAELGKVESTIKHLRRLAKARSFYKNRLLESSRKEREVTYPLLMANQPAELCGVPA